MINKTITELNKIFDYLNNLKYQGKLKKPVILVQTNGGKNTLGWCTVGKVWKDREEKKENYEITLCAEYLNREVPDIIATMLHEMVHLNNLILGIKDTSNGCVYHNKRFKETAEAVGLLVDKAPIIGLAVTSLSDKLREQIKDFKVDEKAFEYFRIKMPKKKTSVPRFKYKCECGQRFSLLKKINVTCTDCKSEFEVEEV